ncbi:hypothetical protein [Flavobacterium gelatinilyticum]|uniref:hypothetical protein n=1 Tax=Flavobacterium gelatinilyticum TaxID=3003260 RepID=UPI0024818A4E|nr:hypothetical protein [Flavobacterium gelatinilyticum]
MIKQLTSTYMLTAGDQAVIDGLIPFPAGIWNDGRVSAIKQEIHRQLLIIQNNNCCYCGLKVNEAGRAEVEHIANKGGLKRPAYVEFVFTKENLAIACQFCNSSSKKGQEDIMLNVDLANYSKCTFKIVHPYFDDPGLHYKWSNGKFKILISSSSPEGIKSIRLFGLDSEAHTLARAKQVMFEKKLERYTKRIQIQNRIADIFKFRK